MFHAENAGLIVGKSSRRFACVGKPICLRRISFWCVRRIFSVGERDGEKSGSAASRCVFVTSECPVMRNLQVRRAATN